MAAIGTRLLTLMIDSQEADAEVSKAVISSEESDSDFITFADARSGGSRTYKLALTFVQDAETGTLWDKVWTMAGQDVDIVVRPYGNATASATQPHFEGTVTIVEPDGELLGGEADPSNTARFVTEVEWTFTAKPTRVTV